MSRSSLHLSSHYGARQPFLCIFLLPPKLAMHLSSQVSFITVMATSERIFDNYQLLPLLSYFIYFHWHVKHFNRYFSMLIVSCISKNSCR